MTININDIYHTIQGEGFYAGSRALFCRTPKCNLACSWCDTTFHSSYSMSQEQFNEIATQEPHRFAVITGGEPLLNKDTPTLISWLKALGYLIAVETNGTMPFKDGIDWVTCSPKRDAAYKIHRDLKSHVSEYKYVVDDDFDFTILDRHAHDQCRLSLSPEFGQFDKNVKKIIDYIKENPQWKISLQTHKFMKIP